MKFTVAGGTGFIGKSLCSELISRGHELTVISRLKKDNDESISYIGWEDIDKLKDAISKSAIVINLAGEPVVGKRWTKEQKDLLYRSRLITTQILVNIINDVRVYSNIPKKLINASAVGIYGDRGDEKITEGSGVGTGFLASICKEWETTVKGTKINTVILRIGVVLGLGGGALEKMLPPFKMFIGGPLGSGKQYMPWISLDDMTSIIIFAAENDNVTGILNATSPNPVTNSEFSSTLGKVLNRPSFISVPGFALKILFGEMAEILLTGQKVYPERVLELGYKFKYPLLEDALRKILQK